MAKKPKPKPQGPHVLPLSTWSALQARYEERPRVQPHPRAQDGDASMRPGDWSGASVGDALRMMRDGWEEGTRKVAAVEAAAAQVVANEPAWELTVAGFFPCIPAYLTGEPDCMFMRTECETPRPRIAVVVPCAYSGGVRPEEVLVYGGAVAAVVGGMEAAGLDVAVYAVDSRTTSSGTVLQGFAIREFGAPMDLSKVAFAFHPAFLRRVIFAADETDPARAELDCAEFGHGRPASLTDETARLAVGEIADVAVRMPELMALWSEGLLRGDRLPELVERLRKAAEAATAKA